MNLYQYCLPKKNIAFKPIIPRDFSRIFVYDISSDKIDFDRFYHLDHYLPSTSFLVLNDTKVMPARVIMKKETGGKVVVLFFVDEITKNQKTRTKDNVISLMTDRELRVGEKIYFNKSHYLEITNQNKNIFQGKFFFSFDKFFLFLEKFGQPPIPPYLKKTPLQKDDLMRKYQTVFARKPGSIAAPTASLHFTNRVFKKLEKKQINKYFITLNVGLGTFAPITEENIYFKKLHQEYFEVDSNIWEKINQERKRGKKLVAVGTTVVRTLESIDRIKVIKENGKIWGKTDLFIFPPFNFQMVDVLITNFHLPGSSLMMLIEAFLQYKKAKKHLVDLYQIAIKNNFRFYSFGDAMVIK